MAIGIFDSGLGGLFVTQSLIRQLPQYSYIYLGDTKRVPYGNRSQEAVYQFTKEGVAHLFEQGCKLVILACNTASAEALRRLQQEWLPNAYPDRRVLGVIIPTVEEVIALNASKVGILATASTVASKAYVHELEKLSSELEIFQQASPLLVPLVEHNGLQWAKPIMASYMEPLLAQGIDTLILGCTHYCALYDLATELAPGITVIAQDQIMPRYLADYLQRHPEIEETVYGTERLFQVTDINEGMQSTAAHITGEKISFTNIDL